ncbi:RING/U-box superfamily protein [Euphorbia peplus]|nr:RING/U-box superfamily protein [Euphorbia peplus]
MAGMLPGVECARRRRFHLSSDNSANAAVSGGSSRRTSFCLYTSNHEISHTSSSVSSLRIVKKEYNENEKLEAPARQAKERLDQRLKTQQRKSSGSKGQECRVARELKDGKNKTMVERGTKKKFNWAKMSWKSSEQEECSICLESYKEGNTLVHLPCAHKFHSKCVVPWLENNAQCPCCRMELCFQFS